MYTFVYQKPKHKASLLSNNTKSLTSPQDNLIDKNNSPIQLISQIKGYFTINPFISISLAITLFSFAGIPPIIGFFGKQMILSAALDNGYVFMSLIAIITSVIGAGYYLNLIKEIFFYKSDYIRNISINKIRCSIINKTSGLSIKETRIDNINYNNITLSSSLSSIISILTLLLVSFIYVPEEWFNIVNILTLILSKS